MELLSLKLIVLGISGVIRLFFGLIPLILFRSLTKNVSGKQGNRIVKYVISVLMFFGGGVLLATCFLHMIPDVRASFETASLQTDVPFPDLLVLGGFFLVYLLEEVVHVAIIHRRRRNKRNKTGAVTGTGKLQLQQRQSEFYHGGTPHTPLPTQMNGGANGIALRDTAPGIYGIPRIRSSSASDNKLPTGASRDSGFTETCPNPNYCQIDPEWWRDTVHGNSQLTLVSASGLSMATLDEIPLNTNGKGYAPMTPNFSNKGQNSEWSPDSSSSKSDEDETEEHSHIPIGIGSEDETVAGAIRNLLIVVAISFHGVFEGLAIGLQGTEKDVWSLFIAVSLHECTILFCIGVELISAQTKVIRMITYITVVSLVSPLGIAIGIIISENSVGGTVAQTILVGCLQGLASGTLLYVTFFEIFAAEGRKLHNKFIHILVAMIGFVMMASLEYLGGHGHSHGHAQPTNTLVHNQTGEAPRLHHNQFLHEEHGHAHDLADHGHDHDHHDGHSH